MGLIGDLNWGLDQITGAAAGAIVDAFTPTPPQPTFSPQLPLTQYPSTIPTNALIDQLNWNPPASAPASFNLAPPALSTYDLMGGQTAWGGTNFGTPDLMTVSGGGGIGTLVKKGVGLAKRHGPTLLKAARMPFTPTGLVSNIAWEAAAYAAPKVWDFLNDPPPPPTTNPIPPVQPWPHGAA